MALMVKMEGRGRRMSARAWYVAPVTTGRAIGRPTATSRAAIEEKSFALFEERGFEATTLDDIAVAVGVGRRTLFRYYASKNDIVWGQFDESLHGFADYLAAIPSQTPLPQAIRDAVVAFNSFDDPTLEQHRRRMHLILDTPALVAHSELRYAEWRAVLADYVAGRLGLQPDDLVPMLAGRMAMAVTLSAYARWLADENADLVELLRQAAEALPPLVTSTT